MERSFLYDSHGSLTYIDSRRGSSHIQPKTSVKGIWILLAAPTETLLAHTVAYVQGITIGIGKQRDTFRVLGLVEQYGHPG